MQVNNTFMKIIVASTLALFVASCAKEPPPPAPTPPAPVQPVTPPVVEPVDTTPPITDVRYLTEVIGDTVHFAFDSSELNPTTQRILRQQADWMKMNPVIEVMIEGHADERGTREYNLALGDRRAVAVQNYLIALGIGRARINTISYGKERPLPDALCNNESCWSQNRRAVMAVNNGPRP